MGCLRAASLIFLVVIGAGGKGGVREDARVREEGGGKGGQGKRREERGRREDAGTRKEEGGRRRRGGICELSAKSPVQHWTAILTTVCMAFDDLWVRTVQLEKERDAQHQSTRAPQVIHMAWDHIELGPTPCLFSRTDADAMFV